MNVRAGAIGTSRCFNHAEREAVARCISCGRHFCRECVAEHDGRMTCAACLRRTARDEQDARRWGAIASRTLQTAAAVITAWLVFHGAGRLLLEAPAPVHEGTYWIETWDEVENP